MSLQPTIGDMILEGDLIYDGPIRGLVVARHPLDHDDPKHVSLTVAGPDGRMFDVRLDRNVVEYQVDRYKDVREGWETSERNHPR